MSIPAGKLDRKVEIFECVETADETGQPVKTYTSKGFAWASVRPVGTSEKMRSGREELAIMLYVMQLRYKATLSVKDKIKYNGYLCDIQSIGAKGRLDRETVEVMLEVLEPTTLVTS